MSILRKVRHQAKEACSVLMNWILRILKNILWITIVFAGLSLAPITTLTLATLYAMCIAPEKTTLAAITCLTFLKPMIQRRLGKLVFPAQDMQKPSYIHSKKKSHHGIVEFLTKDNTPITCLKNKSMPGIKTPKGTSHDRKITIYFPGNSETAIHHYLSKNRFEEKDKDHDKLTIHYRGVSKGQPNSGDMLKEDAVTIIQSIIDDYGYKPENIQLTGYSLGGAIATMAAAELHQNHQPVHLLNVASFSSISQIILQLDHEDLHNANRSIQTKVESISLKLILSFLSNAAIFFCWNMPSSKAWDRIPEAYKNYLHVQRDHQNPHVSCADGIIPKEASLASHIKYQHRNKILNLIKDWNPEIYHKASQEKHLQQYSKSVGWCSRLADFLKKEIKNTSNTHANHIEAVQKAMHAYQDLKKNKIRIYEGIGHIGIFFVQPNDPKHRKSNIKRFDDLTPAPT